jgi:hypothetical protein
MSFIMDRHPLISVVMPVYNRQQYVGAAIESILAQTFTDFEFIIVDDGSRDETVNVINAFDDPRIQLVSLDANRGISHALNVAIGMATGDFIARLDSDDIAMPQRLERQLAHIQAHPQVGICGSSVSWVNEEMKTIPVWQASSNTAMCQAILACDIPFGHPTWMVRRQVYEMSLYQSELEPCEDYDLMVQVAPYWQFTSLQEPLVVMREHPGRVSNTQLPLQPGRHKQICRQFLNQVGVNWDDQQMDAWLHFSSFHKWPSITLPEYISCIDDLIAELLSTNQRSGYLDQDALRLMLARRWWGLCRSSSVQGMPIFRLYRHSPARWQGLLRLIREARMLSLCLGIGRDIRIG